MVRGEGTWDLEERVRCGSRFSVTVMVPMIVKMTVTVPPVVCVKTRLIELANKETRYTI